MARQWYYQVDGAVIGPVGGKYLRAKVAEGVIVSGTLIRQGETGKWVKASRVKSLLGSKVPLPGLRSYSMIKP